MNVLVVDDDEDTTALMSMALAREGWQVDTVPTLAAARAALMRGRYSVLVTDLHMPDGSGMSLLAEPPPHPLQAAIVVTGTGDEQQRRTCLELGFGRCLTKPLTGSEIVAAIRSLLAKVPAAGG
jgi:two-component system response regulator PilR (NtrC family)